MLATFARSFVVHVLTDGDSVLQLEMVKPHLQMQAILNALCQILALKDLLNFLCRSLCHHMILDVLCQVRSDDVTRRLSHLILIFLLSPHWFLLEN